MDGFLSCVSTFDLLWVLRTVVVVLDGIGWLARTVGVDLLVPDAFTWPVELRVTEVLLVDVPVLVLTALSGFPVRERVTVDCCLFLSGAVETAFRLFSEPGRVPVWVALFVAVETVLRCPEYSGP